MHRVFGTIALVLSFGLAGGSAVAKEPGFFYSGRLVRASGEPTQGTVSLKFVFFTGSDAATPVGSPIVLPGVVLTDGVFQVDLGLSVADLAEIFTDAKAAVWIEVTNLTDETVYPKQAFNVVPFALKTPVDGKTIKYDVDGALHVGPAGPAATGEFLTSDGTGKLVWGVPGGASLIEDQVTDGTTTKAPSGNAVFDLLAGKEPTIASGSPTQFWRGDKSWQTLNSAAVPESGNLYHTDLRARTAAVANAINPGVIDIAPSQAAVATGLSAKEGTLTAGTSAQFYRGDKSWQTLNSAAVPESGNLYFTDQRARDATVEDQIIDSVANKAPSQNAVFDGLDAKLEKNLRNVANGFAGLDVNGKVLVANLPYNGLVYKGTWDADTDTPTLNPVACGVNGDYYIISVGGATALSGITPWQLGDWAICGAAGAWQRIGNSSGGVSTVNGQTGATIDLTSDDVDEGSLNLYYSDTRARTAAVANTINDGTLNIAPSQNAVFDALALKIPTSEKGAANGVATLTGAGKLAQDADTLDGLDSANLVLTTRTISTAAGSGLTGGGDLSANHSLSLDISGLTAATTPGAADLVPIYSNAAGAQRKMTRANLLTGVAASGANSDITSLSGLTTALSVAQGGTGAGTLATNGVVLGNGTSAVQTVAPGSSGNVLTSNGTTWTSQAAAAGTVTSVATGAGLTGGAISTTGTINLNLNASGGLSKTLGAGTNELGIAAGGVTNAMLAGSVAQSKVTDLVTDLAARLPLGGGTMTGPILASTGSVSLPSLGFTGDANTGFYSGGSDIVRVATGGVDRVTIDGSGNFGIGTTSPSSAVDIQRTADAAKVSATTFQGGTGESSNFYAVTAGGTQAAPTASTLNQPLGGVGFGGYGATEFSSGSRAKILAFAAENWTNSAQGAYMSFRTTPVGATTMAERVRIDASGNVGIGTTAPTAKLQVTGQIVSDQTTVASGATVNFATGNVQILQSVGGSAITLNNMVDGAAYTLIVTDNTVRTYTFANCTNSHFTPANGATTLNKHTIYTILKTTISAATHCYISWIPNL